MKNVSRILKTIGSIFGAIIVMLFLYPWVLRGFGYYVDNTGGEIGRLAAEKHDVTLCEKIIVYSHILGPPTMSRRGECVYTYAELTKDPTACELLMPSSYGLSCVGGAENHDLPCGSDAYKVYWDDGEEPKEATLRECVLASSSLSHVGQQCCVVARTKYLQKENDCSSLKKETAIYDQCLYGLAWKNRNPNICNGIENKNAKSACTVQTKALQTNPSICSGCTPALESINQLK